MPRASSRSSASASSSSRLARSSEPSELGVGRLDLAPGHLEGEREGHEPLLGAVVEVALDPPPLGVARDDDPGP